MKKPKIILGIETSCDETAAAVCKISSCGEPSADKGVQILSNIVASSADLQAKYGGIIPEQAAREQLKSIIPVIEESLRKAQCKSGDLDAIAVTQGPGLIGSLLVGVETAKTLATIWNKSLIPVNHLLGHFYANWAINHLLGVKAHLESVVPSFPYIGLLVSGGHTDLILFTNHGKFKYLGGTRDDAAGECFDKCARLLDLPYPGGPNLSKLAEKGNPKAFKLPRPMLDSKDLDFSFSGLKTAVYNLIMTGPVTRQPHKKYGAPRPMSPVSMSIQNKADLAASIEDAITDVLVEKTVRAIQTYHVDQLIVAGGVAANKILTKKLNQSISEFSPRARIFIPPPLLCTDNAVSTAICAFYNSKTIDPLKLQANPNLSLSS